MYSVSLLVQELGLAKYVKRAFNPKLKYNNLPLVVHVRRIWSFHVVVSQRTGKKCNKICNTRAELLFCLLNLLFGDVLFHVAVVMT